MKKGLLATTMLVSVAAMGVANETRAAEVKPLGALDINIGGFARWYSFFGSLDNKYGGERHAGTYDFRDDTEVYVYVRGKDEATGLEYGANIELEGDTNTTSNADEAFVFIRGKFGEFRLGDQNGPVEQMITGVSPLGAFSGSLDGVGPIDAGAVVYGSYSDDATKIVYYSPVMSGFQLGVGLTPSTDSNGSNIKTTRGDANVEDLVESGITYNGDLGGVGVLAAVTGAIGKFADSDGESRDLQQIYGGLDLTFGPLTLGGGYGITKGARPVSAAAGDDLSDNYIGNFVYSPGSKQQFFNVGAAYAVGPATMSLAYGQTVSSHVGGGTPYGSDPALKELIYSLAFAVAPGLTLGTEVAAFSNSDNTDDNQGILGLAGVRLAF
ncbi:porin [Arboricoccus pini]|nr:porin [Arboricoccus pini]